MLWLALEAALRLFLLQSDALKLQRKGLLGRSDRFIRIAILQWQDAVGFRVRGRRRDQDHVRVLLVLARRNVLLLHVGSSGEVAIFLAPDEGLASRASLRVKAITASSFSQLQVECAREMHAARGCSK
jgi:hypothetical protein